MRIQWAVFGERNGGHALLAASGNAEFAARITQYTDRPGDPPMGLLWGPVNSGFSFEGYYIFLKTLPDPNAGRAGMVRSYAAFLQLSEVELLPSLSAVFRRLPDDLIEPSKSIDALDLRTDIPSVSADDTLGATAVAQRLGAPDAIFPLVWALPQPYLPVLDAVWGRLPPILRPQFVFAFLFAPEHSLPATPKFVATLPELAGRWPSRQIISPDGNQLRPAKEGHWFSGVIESSSFNGVLRNYGIVVQDFAELNLLSLFAELVSRLPELSFKETLRAVRIVEKYAKRHKAHAPGWPQLFARLCTLVPKASQDDVMTLRNLNAEALSALIEPLQVALTTWIETATSSNEFAEALVIAADAPTSWWSKPFLQWLESATVLPSTAVAQIVCRLLASKTVTQLIGRSLKQDVTVETRLLAGLPDSLTIEHANNILSIAERCHWMRLHATCLLRSYEEMEAIDIHARVAGKESSGFELLQAQLGFNPLFRAACVGGNSNLVRFAGRLLADRDGNITNAVTTQCTHWLAILAQALSTSTGKLIGRLRSHVIEALKPPKTVNAGFVELCKACSKRDLTVWLELSEPTSVLDKLSLDLRAATVAQINQYVRSEIMACRPIEFVNAEAFRVILNMDGLLETILSIPPAAAARAGVNAFRSIPFVSDIDLRRWLVDLFTRTQHVFLQSSDVEGIAEILLKGDFPSAAQVVHDTAEKYFRSDVAPLSHAIRDKYQIAQGPPPKRHKAGRLPKVVIATALPLERKEVIKQIEIIEYDSELFADVGVWPPDDPIFQIYVLATGPGNLKAQSATLRVLHLKPKLAFFVGVAGGLKDSEVGDVIYSTTVHYYEGGKEEDDALKSRPVSEPTSEHLVQLAHRIAEERWQPPGDLQTGTLPKATPAIIASGEKVLASTSRRASTFGHIKTALNDSQVVDMESYGFLKACREAKVPHAMVIRGVSDKLADKAESDSKGNQPLAACNAAAFLFALLRSCRDILDSKKEKKKRRKILGII